MCVCLLGMQLSGHPSISQHGVQHQVGMLPKGQPEACGHIGFSCWQFPCMHSTQDSGKIICHFTSSEMSDKTKLNSNSFVNMSHC